MIQRTILEWQRLRYGDCAYSIPETIAGRLAAVAQASAFAGRGGAGVLDHGRKDIRAHGVVGIVATPGAQLEILPKIERSGEANTVDAATLRQRLIHMLAVAHNIRIEAGAFTHTGWQKDTLLEILIRLFCRKLTDAVRQGIPRLYVDCEDDLPTLRSRLNAQRQFTVLAASPQRLACRFDTLSSDIALNQIMKATVVFLLRLARADDNQRGLRELAFVYADIADVPVAAIGWEKIVLDRTNERWRELLRLAQLLLGKRYQRTSTGSASGYALLFEMNVLFEEYVGRLLTRALAGTGLTVKTQGGHRDCLYEGAIGRFRTKPDIVVRRGADIVLIIDTKWKRMTSQIDDPKQGVSQSDVYQLMAYGQLYDCPRMMLLYPHHHGLEPTGKHRDYAIGAQGTACSLTVATIDAAKDGTELTTTLSSLVERTIVNCPVAQATRL